MNTGAAEKSLQVHLLCHKSMTISKDNYIIDNIIDLDLQYKRTNNIKHMIKPISVVYVIIIRISRVGHMPSLPSSKKLSDVPLFNIVPQRLRSTETK